MKKLSLLFLSILLLTSCITIEKIDQSQQNINNNNDLEAIEEQPDTDLEMTEEQEEDRFKIPDPKKAETPNVYLDYENNEISGHYENGENYFDILLLENDQIQFQGFAIYVGQTVNTGEIADIITINENNQAVYKSDWGCETTITFLDNKIKVTDNYMCGGLNVTFEGQYQKTDKNIPNWDIYDAIHEN